MNFMPAMMSRRNASGRDSARHADETAASAAFFHNKRKTTRVDAGAIGEEHEQMELDWDNDEDEDSWGLMDRADREAIEQELEALSSECESSASSSDSPGGEQQQEHEEGGEERSRVGARNAEESELSAPVERQGHHRSDHHRFIITPEQIPATILEIVVIDQDDDGCWEEDNDDDDDDDCDDEIERDRRPRRLPLDRLGQLMRRSDQSRRSLQKQSLPTRFYTSSRFFGIELERQQLRRMLVDD